MVAERGLRMRNELGGLEFGAICGLFVIPDGFDVP